MLNYFKAGGYVILFSETSPSKHPTAQEAYDMARCIDHRNISIYRVTQKPGVWDRVDVVGHRNRMEILLDLEQGRTVELREELDALEACYRDAGRRGMPLMPVAA